MPLSSATAAACCTAASRCASRTPFAPGVPDPGPDYATAIFTTCPVGEHCTEANSDNRGLTRTWRAGGVR